MSHMISLMRLARLVGLPRSTLQRMAQQGELQMFDGHVELDEVLRAFPNANFEDDSELRRVEEIKEAALSKSQTPALPAADVLAGRLKELSEDYARLESQAQHYEHVHGWLMDHIAALISDGALPYEAGSDLLQWIRRELATVPSGDLRRRQLVKRERFMRVMSAQVKVMPRGLSFETQGNETLLEAGLRAGLSFAYGCSNGNCGECKARVVSGEVIKVRPHDHMLSAAEKANGVTLMCSYAAVGDVEIEAAPSHADEIPEQTILARVRSVESLSGGMLALNLLTPRSERLRFLAGQRIRVGIADEQMELPIASCPCEDRRIEIHVPACVSGADGGTFAIAAHDLRSNDTVTLTGPFGHFVLDETSERPIILIAEGDGFPPIKSLMQHALSLDHAPEIALHWLAGAPGHYQENLPKSYADALDNFTYAPIALDVPIDDALAGIAAHANFIDSEVYAAGSPEFLDRAGRYFAECGLQAERWHADPSRPKEA